MQQFEKRHILSVDPGVSFLKIYNGTQSHTIPTVVQEIHDPEPHSITVDGRHYLVGKRALLHSNRLDVEPRADGTWHGSDDQYVQLCWGAHVLGMQGRAALMAFALPYKDQRDQALKARVKQRFKTLRWRPFGGPTCEVTFDEVTVTAQGTGAWLRHSAELTRRPSTVCVADLGSETLDVFLLRLDGADYQYSAGESYRGEEVSISGCIADLMRRMRNRREFQHRTFGHYDLVDRIVDGTRALPVDGDQVSFANELRLASAAYGERVMAQVREAAGQLWDNVEALVLTGGGASLIERAIRLDKRAVITNNEANVIGQWDEMAKRLKIAPASVKQEEPTEKLPMVLAIGSGPATSMAKAEMAINSAGTLS